MYDRNIVKLRSSNKNVYDKAHRKKYTKLSKYTNNNVVGDVTRSVAANGLANFSDENGQLSGVSIKLLSL